MKKVLIGCLIVVVVFVGLMISTAAYFWSDIQGGIASARENISEILNVGKVIKQKHGATRVDVNLSYDSDNTRMTIGVEGYEIPNGMEAKEAARAIAKTALEHSQPDWQLDEIEVQMKVVLRLGPASASDSRSFVFEIDELR